MSTMNEKEPVTQYAYMSHDDEYDPSTRSDDELKADLVMFQDFLSRDVSGPMHGDLVGPAMIKNLKALDEAESRGIR